MKYSLLKMDFGNTPKSLLKFELDYRITDFCYTKYGFLFLLKNEHCIGKVDFDGKIELPFVGRFQEKGIRAGYDCLLGHPSSVCYSKEFDRAYTIEDGGMTLREIAFNPTYTQLLLTEAMLKPMKKHFDNKYLTETYCDVDEIGQVYWGIQHLHKIFTKDRMGFSLVVGNKDGFSVSSKTKSCSLSHPSGIKCMNETIYILEQGNHCIRQLNNNKFSVLAGIPKVKGDEDGDNLLCKFSCLRSLVGFKNMLYFIDNNKIKYLSLGQKNVGTIYASANIISIDSDKEKTIYILEGQ